jgi:hypothetical protein
MSDTRKRSVRDDGRAVELRRNTLRYARVFPPGSERNRHRQVAASLRDLFRGKKWLREHTREGALPSSNRSDGTKPDPYD